MGATDRERQERETAGDDDGDEVAKRSRWPRGVRRPPPPPLRVDMRSTILVAILCAAVASSSAASYQVGRGGGEAGHGVGFVLFGRVIVFIV